MGIPQIQENASGDCSDTGARCGAAQSASGRLSGRSGPTRTRSASDCLLLAVTFLELVGLVVATSDLSVVTSIYFLQHAIVLVVAMTRPMPQAQDRSLATGAAVAISYAYPYAQLVYLAFSRGQPGLPAVGAALVICGAIVSLASLLSLGKLFGVRPALRGLVTQGTYRLVRHPLYLSYFVSDLGYNLQEWAPVTVSMVLLGWASLLYRIQVEEHILSQHHGWQAYMGRARYRLIPGVW
jgi:protein-S-isoprenylcysteine O-methyltransferase Ste14